MKDKQGQLPIAVFDSGLGGITVLKVLAQHLPRENFIYLGDTARLPYGSKSPTTIQRYVEQNIRYLRSRAVKAIVVACNSASSVLASMDLAIEIPVYGVIEPGSRAAIDASTNLRIGVVGTHATISQNAYPRVLNHMNPQVVVHQQACPLLVPLVEEGWIDDPLTNLVIHRYLGPLMGQGIDTLILGCTHYPALKEAFRKVVGPNIHLIDSAEAIARQIQSDLQTDRLFANTSSHEQKISMLTTDISPRFAEIARQLIHPLRLPTPEQIDLTGA